MKAFIPILLLFCISCISTKKVIQTADLKQQELVPVFVPGPPVLVYKTKTNYNNFVPVILSDDKSEIVSYPHPSDIKTEDGYQTPVILHKGYLLDNRGIGKNVAFLNITYEDYAKLREVPTLKELYGLIIDKDPLIELCNCGVKTAFTNQTKQLNELIDSNKLRIICKIVK
jgi:hypothetical protein